MPHDLVVGNGSLLIGFDSQYRLADFYFPHVGMENHAASRFRFGVWADESLHWTEESAWRKQLIYLRETLVTDVTLENTDIGLRLRCHDTVDADANVYVRKIVVRNLRDEGRKIKLFLHHDFNLYGSATGAGESVRWLTAVGRTAHMEPRTGDLGRPLLPRCARASAAKKP